MLYKKQIAALLFISLSILPSRSYSFSWSAIDTNSTIVKIGIGTLKVLTGIAFVCYLEKRRKEDTKEVDENTRQQDINRQKEERLKIQELQTDISLQPLIQIFREYEPN